MLSIVPSAYSPAVLHSFRWMCLDHQGGCVAPNQSNCLASFSGLMINCKPETVIYHSLDWSVLCHPLIVRNRCFLCKYLHIHLQHNLLPTFSLNCRCVGKLVLLALWIASKSILSVSLSHLDCVLHRPHHLSISLSNILLFVQSLFRSPWSGQSVRHRVANTLTVCVCAITSMFSANCSSKVCTSSSSLSPYHHHVCIIL